VNIKESITTCYLNYANFKGRASRSEYWLFFLYAVILSEIIQFAVSMAMQQPYMIINPHTGTVLYTNAFWVTQVISLFFITIPSASVMIRRLHDSDKSGWWWLVNFTIVGVFYFIYLLIRKGTEGSNRYSSH
jgi:uncharacterized membrane protein YhaH (DUF805 family)